MPDLIRFVSTRPSCLDFPEQPGFDVAMKAAIKLRPTDQGRWSLWWLDAQMFVVGGYIAIKKKRPDSHIRWLVFSELFFATLNNQPVSDPDSNAFSCISNRHYSLLLDTEEKIEQFIESLQKVLIANQEVVSGEIRKTEIDNFLSEVRTKCPDVEFEKLGSWLS